MNKKNSFKYLAGILTVTLLTGCSNSISNLTNTSKEVKPKPKVTKEVSTIKIKLPARYSVENFKEVSMVTQFSGDKSTKDVIDLIETNMMKVKKFTQYARHFGDKASLRDEMHREDTGADIEASKVAKEADYILAAKVTKTKTEQKLSETKSLILFTTELKYQINQSKDNKNISSGVIKGQAKRYKTYHAQWNKRLRRNFYKQVGGHGFNGTENQGDIDAFRQASQRASKTLMYRVGNSFPTGGAIGIWREAQGVHQIQIDSGIDQGALPNQKFVIYTNDGGVDTPVALAKLESLDTDKSTLSLIQWNEKNPFAKKIINNVKKSNYKYAIENDFYAVALSMPDPTFKD